MPRVYELPTHLGVQDQLIGSLTAPQLLKISIGASFGYVVWDQLRWMPEGLRLILAVSVTVVGVVFAVIRPGGRALDQWLVALLVYRLSPRRLAWRPGAAWSDHERRERPDWAELELRPEWLESGNASGTWH
jgi:hypothetical protein